ncbi:MAG: hypothetical protein LC754_14810 [Acidobacteria bacterium]|nr:hypothetical protein [Acidobacteriota bacterium]
MFSQRRITNLSGKFSAHRRRTLAVCGLCAALLISCGRARNPVVETVTTDGVRAQATPAATPVIYAAQLPPRDEDIEAAGDSIAEASVYLQKRQSAPALRALSQARKATHHALNTRERKDDQRKGLLSALAELESVERIIQHGALSDAHRQLIKLDQTLDQLIY